EGFDCTLVKLLQCAGFQRARSREDAQIGRKSCEIPLEGLRDRGRGRLGKRSDHPLLRLIVALKQHDREDQGRDDDGGHQQGENSAYRQATSITRKSRSLSLLRGFTPGNLQRITRSTGQYPRRAPVS